MRHEELLAAPEAHLEKLCRFLGQEAAPDYLEACAGVVERSPHQSRREQQWSDALIEEVAERCRGCDFLAEYAFEESRAAFSSS